MIFKRFSALVGTIVLALASLFSLAFVGQAHAGGITTLYWCEFSSNSDFNNSSNWNTSSTCSGGTNEVPVSGDALVFDNSSLTSSLDITNDISGLDLNSITFQGDGSGGYSLSGDGVQLDAGITDTGTNAQQNTVDIPITLTANQTISTGGTDIFAIEGPITLGSYNLTLQNTGQYGMTINSVSGSGSLTFESGSSAYYMEDADPSFTGPTFINNGAQAQINDPGALGSGLVTIDNGGTLIVESNNNTATVSNPFNLSGSGGSNSFGVISSCLGQTEHVCTTEDTTLTITGNISLSGNAIVANGAYNGTPPANSATFDFTGDITYNGYTLTAAPDSNSVVSLPAVSSSSGSSSKAPGTPDTGEGLAANHTYLASIGGGLLAVGIVASSIAISRKLSKISIKKK